MSEASANAPKLGTQTAQRTRSHPPSCWQAVNNPAISPRQRAVILDSVDQDIRDTGKALIEGMTKAWDRLPQQIDEVLGWSPTGAPAPGERRPSAMADGELRAALRAVASGLVKDIDPALQASFPAEDDPRWRFNLPACVPTHIHHMFTEASDAFGLAVTGLDRHASSADLAAVGRLADILARARWLLEPSDAGQRRERGYALAEAAIAGLRAASDRADEAGGTDQPAWPARSPAGRPPWRPGSRSSGRMTACRPCASPNGASCCRPT